MKHELYIYYLMHGVFYLNIIYKSLCRVYVIVTTISYHRCTANIETCHWSENVSFSMATWHKTTPPGMFRSKVPPTPMF